MDHKPALTVEAVVKCYEARNKKSAVFDDTLLWLKKVRKPAATDKIKFEAFQNPKFRPAIL